MAVQAWKNVPEKHRKVLEWWYQAYKWFNKKYPAMKAKLGKPYDNGRKAGFKWGSLDVDYVYGMSSYGVWSIGGLYTQSYIDYFLLKNAPIKNPPSKRPRKPAGYDDWLARFNDWLARLNRKMGRK